MKFSIIFFRFLNPSLTKIIKIEIVFGCSIFKNKNFVWKIFFWTIKMEPTSKTFLRRWLFDVWYLWKRDTTWSQYAEYGWPCKRAYPDTWVISCLIQTIFNGTQELHFSNYENTMGIVKFMPFFRLRLSSKTLSRKTPRDFTPSFFDRS